MKEKLTIKFNEFLGVDSPEPAVRHASFMCEINGAPARKVDLSKFEVSSLLRNGFVIMSGHQDKHHIQDQDDESRTIISQAATALDEAYSIPN